MTTFYKIRDRVSGLFSTGGYRPRWKKAGKTWSTIGHVKSHLNDATYPPGTAELVECVVQEISTRAIEVVQQEVLQAKAARKQARNERAQRWYREQELRQLQELAAKHGMKVTK